MKFSTLCFTTDENIDVEVKDFLRQKRFDVFGIKEARLFGVLDETVLNADFNVNFPFIIVAENTESSVKIRLRQF